MSLECGTWMVQRGRISQTCLKKFDHRGRLSISHRKELKSCIMTTSHNIGIPCLAPLLAKLGALVQNPDHASRGI